jgi:hypothetical protein
MGRIVRLSVLVLFAASVARSADETTTKPAEPSKVKTALNRAFRGRVVKIHKKRVTFFYDFEDPEQLQDFEGARPPRLLDASRNRFRIEGGRLVLEGSTSVRHKMEGRGELRAHFFVRLSEKRNVGTVFTEPILSDFFIVLNLFDHRFYEDGGLILAGCGLHEDEGADVDMSLVNWRDIFRTNLQNKVRVGEDVEIEVAKDGWTEYFRVNDVEGKGSSKGKTREMKAYQFGFFVHQSRATFDDLTLTIEPTEEFLDLNDLRAEIEREWEEVPSTGVLAGIVGVSPRLRAQVEAYAAGGDDPLPVIRALSNRQLPMKARDACAQALLARRDPKLVPKVMDGLYSEDLVTRELSIRVVKGLLGKDFGYSPRAPEKERSKAIRALNDFLERDRARYYG